MTRERIGSGWGDEKKELEEEEKGDIIRRE